MRPLRSDRRGPSSKLEIVERGRVRSQASWWAAKHPVARFVALFGLYAGGFYAAAALPIYERRILDPYLFLSARLSAWLLNLVGEGAASDGWRLESARFAMDIRAGCDALEPSALLIAAIFAFPAPVRGKLVGVLVGVPILLLVNFGRIVSLFFTGVYRPESFEVLHGSIWQPLFVALVAFLWLPWAARWRRHGDGPV